MTIDEEVSIRELVTASVYITTFRTDSKGKSTQETRHISGQKVTISKRIRDAEAVLAKLNRLPPCDC